MEFVHAVMCHTVHYNARQRCFHDCKIKHKNERQVERGPMHRLFVSPIRSELPPPCERLSLVTLWFQSDLVRHIPSSSSSSHPSDRSLFFLLPLCAILSSTHLSKELQKSSKLYDGRVSLCLSHKAICFFNPSKANMI